MSHEEYIISSRLVQTTFGWSWVVTSRNVHTNRVPALESGWRFSKAKAKRDLEAAFDRMEVAYAAPSTPHLKLVIDGPGHHEELIREARYEWEGQQW